MKQEREQVRNLSAALLLGMLTLPALFYCFFLRRGYSPSLRRSAFLYATVVTLIGLAGAR